MSGSVRNVSLVTTSISIPVLENSFHSPLLLMLNMLHSLWSVCPKHLIRPVYQHRQGGFRTQNRTNCCFESFCNTQKYLKYSNNWSRFNSLCVIGSIPCVLNPCWKLNPCLFLLIHVVLASSFYYGLCIKSLLEIKSLPIFVDTHDACGNAAWTILEFHWNCTS